MKSYAVERTVKHMEKQAAEFYAPWGAAVVALTPSLTVVRVTMDFFQHRYYRLNKIMMILMGQWPYQRPRTRYAFLAAATFLGTNQVVPMTLASMKYRNEPGIVLDFALSIVFGIIYLVKLVGFIVNSQKVIMLLNRIRTDWAEWACDREVNILHQYAEQGRKMTIGYLAMAIIGHFIFIAQPTIPKIIDVILKNSTEPGKFPYPVDYYHLDVQKYYFYIVACCYICLLATLMVIVTHSAMLICYTQHVCGIFAALGHKLERLGNDRTSVEAGQTRYSLEKRDILLLASCINRHNQAFEYVNLIVATYTRTFFFTIAVGTALSLVIGFQIFGGTNNPEGTIRFIVMVVGMAVYFFIECSIAETLIDHSISIYLCIHNSQWYTLSVKAQKLLLFMVMRSSVPCQLTAGKVMAMSMTNFWATVKTIASYVMIAVSLQGP